MHYSQFWQLRALVAPCDILNVVSCKCKTMAVLTIVPVVPWEGAPVAGGGGDQLPNFLPRWFDVWTFSVGLKVTTTTRKKVVNFFCGKSAPQRKSWLRVWEKGPRLTLVWGPQMVNAALCKTVHIDRARLRWVLLMLQHYAHSWNRPDENRREFSGSWAEQFSFDLVTSKQFVEWNLESYTQRYLFILRITWKTHWWLSCHTILINWTEFSNLLKLTTKTQEIG